MDLASLRLLLEPGFSFMTGASVPPVNDQRSMISDQRSVIGDQSSAATVR
jgi:hypothetical protein